MKELTEAARDMKDAMEEAGVSYKETATQTLATAEVASIYIDKLEELREGTEAADDHSQTYLNTLALLSNAIPELSDRIDLETGAIEGGTAALREQTEAWKKNAEAQAYQEYMNTLMGQYNDVMTESAANSIKLTQAQIKLETAEKNRDAALERMSKLSVEACENGTYLTQEYYDLKNALYGYNDEIYTAEREIRNLNKAIDADAEAVAAAEAEINSAREAIEQLTGATEEITEAEAETARQTAELNGVIGGTMEQVQSLVAAYEDAYNAAYESISGQYAIWDEAAKVVEVSAGTINNALESQIAYWQDYNANLQSLTERSADIEGLSDVIASFADGSQDSVNAIAGMAKASDDDLRAMVQNWQDLQQAQAEASEAIAGVAVDLAGQMDEFQQTLAEDIKAMDLGNEAAEAGRATLQGYIDGANSMLPQVQAAYKELARAASSALGTPSYSNSAYYANNNRGYASGTKSADPGWAMVGENGPELMFFNGGEQVLNAAETSAMQSRVSSDIQMMTMAPQLMAMLNAYSGHGVGTLSAELGSRGAPTNISVSVPIQVTGNAGPDTLEALRDLGNKLADILDCRPTDSCLHEGARKGFVKRFPPSDPTA